MIALSSEHLTAIAKAAEAAWPEECCGLLIGTAGEDGWLVTRLAASANVAEGDRGRRFEVDPRVLFAVQRELRGAGEQVIGVYHSHPDEPARPSAADLEQALDPDLVWLVTALEEGRAGETTAHVLVADGARFEEIPLRVAEAGSAVAKDREAC